ncbi:ArsC/Spx/MgsR family protein [Lactococcus formosensis]|uniref:ArsC/Spx/MgsR family protein n=1 Tax=Lactococcus formosensis TaxID=1281486 RepID=UPI0022E3BE56|nr:ArsC/Spx/MgsR family protein [Lactococcus formosensis]NHI67601.1 transcriptional regulator Spx [Lactococcus garvieae]
MINVYRKTKSDRRVLIVIDWLESHHIPYKIISSSDLSMQNIKQMLSLSENGFDDILVSRLGISSQKQQLNCSKFEEVPMQSFIQQILQSPGSIKEPILFDETKIMIGYNSNEIRKFIPKSHRRVDRGDFSFLV